MEDQVLPNEERSYLKQQFNRGSRRCDAKLGVTNVT